MEQSKFPRKILLSAINPETYAITVVLGVFNGHEYLESMKNQLLSQENQNFHLIVIDNDSRDQSLLEILKWNFAFPNRLTIVKNSFNLGGTGTLINNFDLISTTWFTSFHQDDFYGPSHVSTLVEGIENAPSNTIAISTVMASMNGQGRKIGTIPRASMFTKNNDPLTSFLQNLRTHSVPWPATAFRSEVYKKTFSPLHSTSFPDTEQILRMCAYGRFLTIDKETMYYRENAESESHSIISAESELGTALAICRILNSSEFALIVRQIPENRFNDFVEALIDTINFRLEGSILGGFTIYNAVESIIAIVGYKKSYVVSVASKLYKVLGSDLASSLLERIARQEHSEDSQEETKSSVNSSVDRLHAALRMGSLNSQKTKGPISNVVNTKLFQRFPYWLKKTLIKIAILVSQKLGKSQQFNFNWTSKDKADE